MSKRTSERQPGQAAAPSALWKAGGSSSLPQPVPNVTKVTRSDGASHHTTEVSQHTCTHTIAKGDRNCIGGTGTASKCPYIKASQTPEIRASVVTALNEWNSDAKNKLSNRTQTKSLKFKNYSFEVCSYNLESGISILKTQVSDSH